MDCLTRKSMFTATSTLLMTLSTTLTTLSTTLFITAAKIKPCTPMHLDDNLNDVDNKFNDDESFKDIVDDLFAEMNCMMTTKHFLDLTERSSKRMANLV
jgi:hypothetical protein